ncbi:hypothetical protein [Burkholderia gladioli]|uniref:hypothetical protein n=1 Tax=Burkholderia gladioli TaxID=28095 RepID=UPI0016402696|nr:hypothetical protein [Burkholderia gladioli]
MLSQIETWIAAKRWRLSASHCIEALLIQGPVTGVLLLLAGLMLLYMRFFGAGGFVPLALLVALLSPWAGVLAVIAWYWARKKLEVETSLANGRSHAFTWADGWFPWQWDAYQRLDVLFPAVSSFLLAALLAVGLTALL